MKEALSTGRARGWTLETWQQPVGLRVHAQWEAMAGAEPYSPRTSEVSYSSSSLSSCQPRRGCRMAESTSTGCMQPSQASGSSLIGCFSKQFLHVHLCQAPCWALRTFPCSGADLALPSRGSQGQPLRSGSQTMCPVIGKLREGPVPHWGQDLLLGRGEYLRPSLLASALIW